MSSAQPILRLVRDDDPPHRPISDPMDTLAQVQSLQNEVAVLNSELSLLRRDREMHDFHFSRLNEELRLAARLQQDFLPKTLPQLGPVHFHTLFLPAGYVSGDFYDVMRLDEKHIGFYIADAVGHGVPAALLTMFIKHALVTKQITDKGYNLLSPAQTLTRLNGKLLEQNLSAAMFATAVYGIINIQTLQVTFARAGHPHPILLGGDRPAETLECDGGLLGIFPDATFEQHTFTMAHGDRLILLTDGIEVLFSEEPKGDTQRWLHELLARRALPAEQMLNEFADLIDHECGGRRPKDDLTIMTLEVR
jgi:sigma-B regulation protein RsbU (phosphoserine phosphatase)